MDLTPVLHQVRDLGGYIREQRQAAELSLRGLAQRSGISNPYLSQVERGLRRPSAAIITQIADGLSISAELLLARAGVIPPRVPGSPVEDSIRADPLLTDRHKSILIDTYRALVDSAGTAAPAPEPASTEPASTEPASTEPATTEPATTEPSTTGA